MAYATHAQVEIAVGGPERLRQLADLDNSNTENTGVVSEAIAVADSTIDSYLGKRYATPLSVVPAVVAHLSAYWAARVLRRNRYNGQPLADDNEQEYVDRKWLEGVSRGEISLGIDPGPAKASMVIDRASPRDAALTVSRDRTRGFW